MQSLQRNNTPSGSSTAKIIHIILLIIAGFFIYSGSLQGEFIWEDGLYVKDNRFIRSWSYLPVIFTHTIAAGNCSNCSHHYRPLQETTYLIDYSIWGPNPFGYHVSNIILHILVALCIYILAALLSKDLLSALLASLLFLVHPVHVQAIDYITNRAEPLVALFVLTSFILYIRYYDRKKKILYMLCLLSYAFALLSKENSLILPVLLLLYHISFKIAVRWRAYCGIIALSLIYIVMRAVILHNLSLQVFASSTLWKRIPGFFVAFLQYIRLLFVPFGLHMAYKEEYFSFLSPGSIAGLITLSLLIIMMIRMRKDRPLYSFSIGWFLLCLMPTSNIFFPLAFYMTPHYLYLPSLGFVILAAEVVARYGKTRISIRSGCWALIIIYASAAVLQHSYWRSPESFFKKSISYAPDNAGLYINYGTYHNKKGNHKKALKLYKVALDIYRRQNAPASDKSLAYGNIGNVYLRLKDFRKAQEYFQKSIDTEPSVSSFNGLASLHYAKGQIEKAVFFCEKSLALNPEHGLTHNNLAVLFLKQKDYERALIHAKKAQSLGYPGSLNLIKQVFNPIDKSKN